MSKLEDGDMIPVERLGLVGSAMPGLIAAAKASLIGKTVREVGYVYLDGEAWPAIVFADGTSVVAQRDDEANGPGVMSITDSSEKNTLLCQVLTFTRK